MLYRSDENFIYLMNTPFGAKHDIKTVLNGHWTKKGWRFPKNVHVYRELYKFFPELKNDTEFMKDAQEESQREKFWLHMKESGGLEYPELRPYQNQDVHFLSGHGSSLVLNEPRTGKTPTMIKTMAALNRRRNIVICPSSLVYNWAREFEKWCPEIQAFPVTGTKKKRSHIYDDFGEVVSMTADKAVLIVSKDTWKLEKELHEWQFDVAIIDEAHFLRNYKSAQSKAIYSLKANIKYALTGTPAVKHGVDVYGLLHFINPKAFPSYWQFAERYWEIDDGHWGKSITDPKKNRVSELKSIMETNSVQRKRKDVMGWLPEAEHQNLYVKMEGKQLKLYEQMLETFMATDDDTEVDTMNKLSQLLRLRQLCLDPRLLGFEAKSAKTQALLEHTENNTDPFIVMTTFSSYFKLIKPDLEKLGRKVEIIDGSVPKAERSRLVELFQTGHIDILLCNIIAAGTGFTLDKADTIIFLDKDFNPANNEQAQDRIVPTTKERLHNINIISIVCGGSIDERVNEILDNKEDLTKLINRPEVFK